MVYLQHIKYNMTFLETIISTVAPHTCIGCGKEPDIICSTCCGLIKQSVPGVCYKCNAISPNNRVCIACKRLSCLSYVYVRTNYIGLAKELVVRFKFNRARSAHRTLAQYLLEVPIHQTDIDLIVPIPTVTSRKRQRGYDQTVLIAREYASKNQLPCKQLLIRKSQTSQVGSTKQLRIKQLKNDHLVTNQKEVLHKNILLIDDVITTGSTIESAAKTLKLAGAKRVDALVFAKA